MNAHHFGMFLRQRRTEMKLTTRKLAQLTGVSAGYLSLVENGKRDIPSPDVLRKLAKGLQIPYEELMTKAGYITGDPDPAYEYELEELLKQVRVTLRGKKLSEEDKQRIIDVVTGVFWESHKK